MRSRVERDGQQLAAEGEYDEDSEEFESDNGDKREILSQFQFKRQLA